MVRFKALRLLAVLAVFGLLASACGTDDTADDTTDVTDGADTPTPAVDTPTATPGDDETEPTVEGEGLRLGYLLPETGQLAFLGPAQIQGVELAVSEINEAGGVLDEDVVLIGGDEAGDAAVASSSVDRLLGEGVHAIVGAAASGMSLAVIDKIVQSGVLQCSASNTSPTFTDYDDQGLYFRTAPSDALQGPVLAETIVDDGNSTVAILARADDYGEGLADATDEALQEAGAEVAAKVIYDPEAATFDAEVQQVTAANPDAVAVIAFDEGVQLISSLLEAGIGADQLYGADGIRSTGLNEDVDPGNPNVLDGMKGTAPDPSADPEYMNRLQEFAPDLEETVFSAQAHDCAILIGLAAVAAGSTDGQAMADEMVGLTTGDNQCSDFAECVEFLENDETIDYQMASGVEEFTENGEPNGGSYEVWGFENGELVTHDTVSITLE